MTVHELLARAEAFDTEPGGVSGSWLLAELRKVDAVTRPDIAALREVEADMKGPLPPVRFPLSLHGGVVWQDDGDGLDLETIGVLNRLPALLARCEELEGALRPFAALDDEGLDRSLGSGMATAGGTIKWAMLDRARALLEGGAS